jgi:hypothetical protein
VVDRPVLLAGAFFAGAFVAALFAAGVFVAVPFELALFVAELFVAGVFFAGALVAELLVAGVFFAGVFFAAAFVAELFFAGVFVAACFVVDGLVADLFALPFVAVLFVAADVFRVEDADAGFVVEAALVDVPLAGADVFVALLVVFLALAVFCAVDRLVAVRLPAPAERSSWPPPSAPTPVPFFTAISPFRSGRRSSTVHSAGPSGQVALRIGPTPGVRGSATRNRYGLSGAVGSPSPASVDGGSVTLSSSPSCSCR